MGILNEKRCKIKMSYFGFSWVYTSEDLKWDALKSVISNHHWNLTLEELKWDIIPQGFKS
jgi:hypothetical protein